MKEDLVLLVIKTQLGDKSALNSLLLKIEEPLYGFIRRLVKDEDNTKDILQEVLIIIASKIKWVNEPKAFKAWCYRIAFRETLKYFKHRRIAVSFDLYDDQIEIKEEPDIGEASEQLVTEMLKQVNMLSASCKLIIEMHYFDGLKLQQIADILDISIGTVKSRLNYGLTQLRINMGSQYGQ